ncbi:MAG: YbaN family protein [Acidimicrobiia bacterium]|nr:YbaN family protein [Acidimicrobiia bacterium]
MSPSSSTFWRCAGSTSPSSGTHCDGTPTVVHSSRIGFGGGGWIGIVVPGLPTTVFFIIAAWAFAKSNPRLEAWVLELPGVGQAVADYRNGLGMLYRAKVVASVMLVAAVTLSAVVAVDRWVIRVPIVVAGGVGLYWIHFRVPTRHPDGTSDRLP